MRNFNSIIKTSTFISWKLDTIYHFLVKVAINKFGSHLRHILLFILRYASIGVKLNVSLYYLQSTFSMFLKVIYYIDFITKNWERKDILSQFKIYNIWYILNLRNIVTKLEFNMLKI